MKKIFSVIALLMGSMLIAYAVPARPGKYKFTQPDGTVILLENHGDEFYHWTTNEKGQIVEKDANGFYQPVTMSREQHRRMRSNSIGQRSKWSTFETAPETNFGDRKVLCILAEFTDSTFTLDDPKQRFSDLLNQEGYSYNHGVGSVRDYYIENSNNKYRPTFDVYGPVKLSHSSAYYDQNGVYLAIQDAYELLQSEIPIEDYDTNNNGKIDMVLFYYPGHNQAEGAGEESIWPHQGNGNFGYLGSKRFVRYFCTSEYRGVSGTDMCGIGTTCHEFAHSLGLPDFYDTDYEANGYNPVTTYFQDLMSGGNYLEDGRRPPHLNLLERNMLGWIDYPEYFHASGSYILDPVQNNQGYMIDGTVPGEYYIFEYRNREGWDASFPHGLMVYRIDKSDRIVADGMTAAQLWETNKINAYGGHACCEVIPCIEPVKYMDDVLFPGRARAKSLKICNWEGEETGVEFSDLEIYLDCATFQLKMDTDRLLHGKVTDSNGHPLKNCEIVLSRAAHPFAAAPGLLQDDIVTHTDDSGYYEMEWPMEAASNRILQARLEGYVSSGINLDLKKRNNLHNFVLLAVGQAPSAEMIKFDPNSASLGYNLDAPQFPTQIYGTLFTSEMIDNLRLAGCPFESISFMGGAHSYDKIYVVVDFIAPDGSGKNPDGYSLLRDVTSSYTPNQWVTVDISDANLVIPQGYHVMLGWAVENVSVYDSPLITFAPEETDNCCYISTSFTQGGWYPINGIPRQLGVLAKVARRITPTPDAYGVSYITFVNGTPELIPAAGKTVKQVQWSNYGDKIRVATATYYDGTSEEVFYEAGN